MFISDFLTDSLVTNSLRKELPSEKPLPSEALSFEIGSYKKSSWRKFVAEGRGAQKIGFSSPRAPNDDADFNEVIPANLSVDDFFLLPYNQQEIIFQAILRRGNHHLFAGNYKEAVADEIFYLSILDRLGKSSLEVSAFGLYHLALGEDERGLRELKEMAAKTGSALSYLLLKSLNHPLPPFIFPVEEWKDDTLAGIKQLFKRQRFEEARASCDEFLAEYPLLGPLTPISDPSTIDPSLLVEELELGFNSNYEILTIRGLCKGMLNDFSGAIQDYDQLISLLENEPFYYRLDDWIVKVKFIYPSGLNEKILERGYLYYLNGDKDKACADFDRLISNGSLGDSITLFAAASKEILFSKPSLSEKTGDIPSYIENLQRVYEKYQLAKKALAHAFLGQEDKALAVLREAASRSVFLEKSDSIPYAPFILEWLEHR